MSFTDTTIIIRGTVITITDITTDHTICVTDITTDHTISVMVTTHTLGFIALRPEPGSTSGSASDAAQAVRMMCLIRFSVLEAEGCK